MMSEKSHCLRRVSPGAMNGRSSTGKAALACGPSTMVSMAPAASANGRWRSCRNTRSSKPKRRPASIHSRSEVMAAT